MATDKQRFSITVDDDLYKKIDDFRFERRIKSQSKAVNELMEMGFDALMGNEVSIKPSFSSFEISIIERYNALDDHGREIIDFLLKKEYERCQLDSDSQNEERIKSAKKISDEVRAEMRAQRKVD